MLRAEKLPFGQPAVYLAARFAADSLSGQPAVMPSIPPRSHLLVLRRLTRFYSIEIAKAYDAAGNLIAEASYDWIGDILWADAAWVWSDTDRTLSQFARKLAKAVPG